MIRIKHLHYKMVELYIYITYKEQYRGFFTFATYCTTDTKSILVTISEFYENSKDDHFERGGCFNNEEKPSSIPQTIIRQHVITNECSVLLSHRKCFSVPLALHRKDLRVAY